MTSAGEPLPVILYSKPGCQQCVASARALDTKGVAYRKIDVTQSEQAEARVRELGYQNLPVIDVPFDREIVKDGERFQHWYGFRPDLIDLLAATAAA